MKWDAATETIKWETNPAMEMLDATLWNAGVTPEAMGKHLTDKLDELADL